MSNAVFPLLPGLKLEHSKTPQWATKARSAMNGREVRQSFYSSPIWKFDISYEVLRTYTLVSELAQIVGFFNNRRGSFDSFLFNDRDKNTVIDQAFGNVIAGFLSYQLIHSGDGFPEPIGAAQGAAVLKANGVTISPANYSIDENGRVTFTNPPVAGAALTWSGQFYYRVRFVDDAMEFAKFNKQLWQAKKINLISVKV